MGSVFSMHPPLKMKVGGSKAPSLHAGLKALEVFDCNEIHTPRQGSQTGPQDNMQIGGV